MKDIRYILHKVKAESPVVYGIVVLHFILALGCLLGIFADDRLLKGINVWIKPLKFCVSGGIYIFTVAYLIKLYPVNQWKRTAILHTVAWTLLVEVLIIILQAGRGVGSHYNTSSALDGSLFGIMGIFIGINVFIMGIFIVDTIRLKLATTSSMQWAILLGWVVVFFGSWVGGQMIGQLSHNVGIPDGGAGLPLLNWSTVGGDLRVAHFFGLHAIQIIPIFGYWVQERFQPSKRNLLIAISSFAAVYMVVIGFTYFQAMMGLPIVRS